MSFCTSAILSWTSNTDFSLSLSASFLCLVCLLWRRSYSLCSFWTCRQENKNTLAQYREYTYGLCHANTSLGLCEQRQPWSDCTSTQSDQGLCCSLTELLHTTEWYVWRANVQMILSACTGWCEFTLFVHTPRHFLAWCDVWYKCISLPFVTLDIASLSIS